VVPDSQATAPEAPRRLYTNLTIALLCLIWGSTWLVIKEGLRDLPIFSGAALRFTIAAVILWGVAPALHRREKGGAPPRLLWLTMGTLNFALAYGAVYWAESRIPSGVASVLWGIFPLIAGLLAHWFLPKERLAARALMGLLLGFSGIVWLFFDDLGRAGPGARLGGLVLLCSPVVAAIGQTVIKRHGERVSAVLLARNAMPVGALLLWIVALASEDLSTIRWTPTALLSLAYLSTLGTVITFVLYYWLLRYSASTKLSLIAYVTPALALWLGAVFADELIGISTLGGTVAILLGVYLASRHPGRGAKSSETQA
jgi:drug/metabolite transporter (DMT)-like permease